jgi:REP element-mobilizing transposase RayT
MSNQEVVMQPSHITWSTEGRLPIFPDEQLRSRAVRKLAGAAQDQLAMFCIVDEHVHVVLFGEPEVLVRRVRAITRSLRGLAAVPLESPRVRPIEGRSHMQSVFGYVLRQPAHHGLPVHPALWSGSCLPDLVGARQVEGMRLCLREVMPRVTVGDVFTAVGLPRTRLESAGRDRLVAVGAHEVVRVASGALGVVPPLDTQEPDVVRAKRAASVLAREAGLSLQQVADAAGISARTARRLSLEPLPENLRQVVMRRFTLEQRAQRAPCVEKSR